MFRSLSSKSVRSHLLLFPDRSTDDWKWSKYQASHHRLSASLLWSVSFACREDLDDQNSSLWWPKYFSFSGRTVAPQTIGPGTQLSRARLSGAQFALTFSFHSFSLNITVGHWFQHYVWSEAWSLGVLYQSVLKESLYTLQHCACNMHPQMWQLPLLLNYHPAPPSGDLI